MGRVDGRTFPLAELTSCARQHGPRQLGPSTRVVETGLKACTTDQLYCFVLSGGGAAKKVGTCTPWHRRTCTKQNTADWSTQDRIRRDSQMSCSYDNAPRTRTFTIRQYHSIRRWWRHTICTKGRLTWLKNAHGYDGKILIEQTMMLVRQMTTNRTTSCLLMLTPLGNYNATLQHSFGLDH